MAPSGGIIPILRALGLVGEAVKAEDLMTLEQMAERSLFWFGIVLMVVGVIFLSSFRKWRKKHPDGDQMELVISWWSDCWDANALRGQALCLIGGILFVCFFNFFGWKADTLMALGMFVAVMMPAYLRPAWTFDKGEKWHLWYLTFFPSMSMGLLGGASILDSKRDPTTLFFIVLLVAINWAYWGTGGMSREAIGSQLTAGGGTGKLAWVDAVMNGLLSTRNHALWKSIILMMGQGRYRQLLVSEEWKQAKLILAGIDSNLCDPIKDVRILESIADPDQIEGLIERCVKQGVTGVELAELQLEYWFLYLAPEDGFVRDERIDQVTVAVKELSAVLSQLTK